MDTKLIDVHFKKLATTAGLEPAFSDPITDKELEVLLVYAALSKISFA